MESLFGDPFSTLQKRITAEIRFSLFVKFPHVWYMMTLFPMTGVDLLEPAHMELAAPSISTAVANLLARGAKTIVLSPFFLGPGRHWKSDLPTLLKVK